ncbi:hypothetical protein LCGC14_3155180 [marine sediment metagenome]|uniref:Uncharacterized protein n=1 Tax=marine sediment metagenome TaxID=412755 RepID=A0A0F8VT07_9ZZZZ
MSEIILEGRGVTRTLEVSVNSIISYYGGEETTS